MGANAAIPDLLTGQPKGLVPDEWMQEGLDATDAREICRVVPTAVAAVAALTNGEPTLMLLSSFTAGVSFDPPMCSIAVQRSSSTWPMIEDLPALGISLLGTEHQDKIEQLGSRFRGSRLDGIEWVARPSGAVLLKHAPLWIEAKVMHKYPAGDHLIVVMKMQNYRMVDNAASIFGQEGAYRAL